MKNQNVIAQAFARVRSGPALEILALIALTISVLKDFGEFKISPLFAWAVIATVGFFAARALVVQIRALRSEELPEAVGVFSPFKKKAGWKPWERALVTKELAQVVRDTKRKHVLIVSPSGTGKSTMINALLPNQMQEYCPVLISNYNSIVGHVLTTVARNSMIPDLIRRAAEIDRKIESGGMTPDHLDADLRQLSRTIRTLPKMLVCFDQVERYFLRFDDATGGNYEEAHLENGLLRVLLKHLALCDNIRTVFAVRSEYIFGSLSSMFNFKSNGSDLEDYVEFYFLWGVNSADDRDVYSVVSNLLDTTFGGKTIGRRLFDVAKVHNRTKANTFLLCMGGYLFETLYSKPRYRKRLSATALTGDDLIDVYLDAAFEGLIAVRGVDDRCLFDTVLYSLANDAKVSGQAATTERVAGLAHFSLEEVEELLQYLASIGLVECNKDDGADTYRLSHEKLSDRLLKGDRLDIDSRAVDGIRYLTQNRVTAALTIPSRFPSSIEFDGKSWRSQSYLAVVVFAAFGMLRLAAPHDVLSIVQILPGYKSWLAIWDYPFQAYYLNPIYYAPHLIADIAWISYIDRVNRAYLQNVLDGATASFANFLAPIGAILGILCSFTPELFVVPIVVIGFLYGIILLFASASNRFHGQIKEITFKWGYRSCFNVLIVFLLSWQFVAPNLDVSAKSSGIFSHVVRTEVGTYLFVLILIEAVLLLWFWQHIRADQNTRKIWSANLSLFDKGRIYGK